MPTHSSHSVEGAMAALQQFMQDKNLKFVEDDRGAYVCHVSTEDLDFANNCIENARISYSLQRAESTITVGAKDLHTLLKHRIPLRPKSQTQKSITDFSNHAIFTPNKDLSFREVEALKWLRLQQWHPTNEDKGIFFAILPKEFAHKTGFFSLEKALENPHMLTSAGPLQSLLLKMRADGITTHDHHILGGLFGDDYRIELAASDLIKLGASYGVKTVAQRGSLRE